MDFAQLYLGLGEKRGAPRGLGKSYKVIVTYITNHVNFAVYHMSIYHLMKLLSINIWEAKRCNTCALRCKQYNNKCHWIVDTSHVLFY